MTFIQGRGHLITTGQNFNIKEGTMAETMNSSITCRNNTTTQAQGGTMDGLIDFKNLLSHPVSQRTFLHRNKPTFVHFATR